MAKTVYKIVESVRRGAGTTVLHSTTGASTLADFTSMLTNYYTKTELQTEGSALVHFNNIIEAYHNNLLDLQGGLVSSSGDSSGNDAEYYHLDLSTYLDVTGISFVGSIEKDSINAVALVGDLDSPGNSKYYGTDSGGVKGWHDLPAGGVQAFQTITFANPLEIDCSTYKDWVCIVTDDTTINLNNVSDGDAGMLELIIEGDSSGASLAITFGTMWTKKMGAVDLDASDGADNIISWRAIGDGSLQEIVYTIGVIEV